jgi:adenylyl-sulfate kinase
MRAGFCVWFTGLPCAGKSTLAAHLARRLEAQGMEVALFDGDVVRKDVSSDLGFSREHRHANALRVASAARAVVERGAVAVCALVSPYRESRAQARELVGAARFVEVYVDTPLEVCEARDVKGMYRMARAGELEHFTGVSDPYEAPMDEDVRVIGSGTPEEAIAPIVDALGRCGRGWL